MTNSTQADPPENRASELAQQLAKQSFAQRCQQYRAAKAAPVPTPTRPGLE